MHFLCFLPGLLFILYSFKYTGKLNTFDWIIYWGEYSPQECCNPPCSCISPWSFPETHDFVARNPSRLLALIYLPGLLLSMQIFRDAKISRRQRVIALPA